MSVLLVSFLPAKDDQKPPSPPGWPIVGHSIDFLRNTAIKTSCEILPERIGNTLVDVFTKYRKRCGGIYRIFPFIGFECVVVSEATYIKHILSGATCKNYVKSQSAFSSFAPLLGGGLVTLEHAEWKFHRTLINPLFRFDSLNTIVFDLFLKTITTVADTLVREIQQSKENVIQLDLMEVFRELTLKIIAKATLGKDEDEYIAQFMDIYSIVIAEINLRVWYPHRKYFPTKSNALYKEKLEQLDQMILDLIQERRKSPTQHQDLLGLMILAKDSTTQRTLTDDEILCEVKTFMLAGHETSSMWLAYAFHCLAHPDSKEYCAKVRQECQLIFSAGPLTPASLNVLPHTTNALKETLRLFPIVPLLVKEAVKEDIIGGYKVSAGSHVAVDVWGAHHDPKYWGPDANKFIPDRFQDSWNGTKPHVFSYLPFSLGPRNCLGQNFAFMEAKLVMIIFMSTFDMSPMENTFLTMDRFDIPLHPRKGINMKVKLI